MDPALPRIVVSIAPEAPGSRSLLREAAALASTLHGELVGIVLENLDLLRSAELPIVRELDILTARERQCDRVTIESSLRSRTNRARQAFEALARETGVRHSFEVRRRRVTWVHLGPQRPRRSVCVLLDDASSWEPLIETARLLSQEGRFPLELVYCSEATPRASELHELQTRLRQAGLPTSTRTCERGFVPSSGQRAIVVSAGREHDELLDLINAANAPTVVVGASAPTEKQ